MDRSDESPPAAAGSAAEVFRVFLRLGLTSFGGPVAHLGFFRDEIVARRRWLDDRAYADLVALCQFLPGPASSQVGIGIGLGRAGIAGALAAWAGFTLPSAVALILFAYGVTAVGGGAGGGWIAGLKVAAVAVVAQAVWGMARSLAPDRARATIAVAGALVALGVAGAPGQLAAIATGAGAGLAVLRPEAGAGQAGAGQGGLGRPGGLRVPLGRPAAIGCLVLFALLLALLPLAAAAGGHVAAAVDSFYRAGSLVFGGGHVVLPLLQAEVVPPGWVGEDTFLAGYGAAQAVPGPLFTFAAFLGAAMEPAPHGWAGGLLCLAAIFLPSFLLVLGALPFWAALAAWPPARAALSGVNASVVGLLLAALYDPIWTSTIAGPADYGLLLVAFLLLALWRVPPWAVVALCAVAGGAPALV